MSASAWWYATIAAPSGRRWRRQCRELWCVSAASPRSSSTRNRIAVASCAVVRRASRSAVDLLEDLLGLGERGVEDLGLGGEGARVGLAADPLERRVAPAVGVRVIARGDPEYRPDRLYFTPPITRSVLCGLTVADAND